MDEERLGSPRDFAVPLARHLSTFEDPSSPLPSDEDLATLCEVMFFASLHYEEGRRVGFNAVWEPSDRNCAALVALTTPVRATPKSLVKLAPATQRDATSIAVRREGRELVAWALVQRSAASTVTIRALAPGVLRVDYASVPRALYARGEVLLLGGEHDVKSPARRLTGAFADWSAADLGIDPRAAVITRIAGLTLEHGHGGMILLVPADVGAPLGVRMHYGVGGGADMLAKRYAEVVRDVPAARRLERLREARPRASDGRVQVRDQAQIALSETMELIARLTAIDNALLMDTDLCIRGFGVQVIEADAPRMTFEHVSPYSNESHVDDLATFKGTRHPAGVIFCMRQAREAAAIIASQDGRLSLAIKDAHGVVEVVGSYEHAFGWR